MRVSCIPSAECDDAHEAKQLFDVVGLLCSIFFGIPLGLVLLRMVSGLSNSDSDVGLRRNGFAKGYNFWSDSGSLHIRSDGIYMYIRYRQKMELQK